MAGQENLQNNSNGIQSVPDGRGIQGPNYDDYKPMFSEFDIRELYTAFYDRPPPSPDDPPPEEFRKYAEANQPPRHLDWEPPVNNVPRKSRTRKEAEDECSVADVPLGEVDVTDEVQISQLIDMLKFGEDDLDKGYDIYDTQEEMFDYEKAIKSLDVKPVRSRYPDEEIPEVAVGSEEFMRLTEELIYKSPWEEYMPKIHIPPMEAIWSKWDRMDFNYGRWIDESELVDPRDLPHNHPINVEELGKIFKDIDDFNKKQILKYTSDD